MIVPPKNLPQKALWRRIKVGGNLGFPTPSPSPTMGKGKISLLHKCERLNLPLMPIGRAIKPSRRRHSGCPWRSAPAH
jgi:hypothetical protein